MHCARQRRFICALVVGSILSSFWFFVHFYFARVHDKDSAIINYTGSLRYFTQKIALVMLSRHKLPSFAQTIADPVDQLTETLNALLGRRSLGAGHALGDGKVPDIEMVDHDVKTDLIQWEVEHLSKIRETYRRHDGLQDDAAVSEALEAVNRAIEAVDIIVFKASEASHGRVQVLVVISIVRAAVGLLWAIVVTVSFGSAWRPYVANLNRLQEAEQQTASVLRAAFDAVVLVSPVHPFNIVVCDDNFDDLLGRSMAGQSILSCAETPADEQELLSILTMATGTSTEQDTLSLRSKILWSDMLPQRPPERLPVAAMISTNWTCGADEVRQRIKVEIMVVNRWDERDRPASTMLLVVRRATDAGVPLPPAPLHAREIVALPQVQQSAPGMAMSLHGRSARSESTADTTNTGMAGTMTPRSAEFGTTPPPSMARGMVGTRAGSTIPGGTVALSDMPALIGRAIRDLEEQLDDSSTASATTAPTAVSL